MLNSLMNHKQLFHLIGTGLLAIIFAALVLSPAQADIPEMWKGECEVIHVAEKGESLSDIAGLYGVKKQDLIETNFISTPAQLDDGEMLCIPYVMVELKCPAPLVSGIATNHKKLFLWGSNFPKGDSLLVRMREHNQGPYKEVGSVQVKSDNSISGTYKIPPGMSKAELFDVCLRSKKYNFYTCITVTNY